MVYGQADINIEQIIDIGYSFGEPTKALYIVDMVFMEEKSLLKPTYLNIVNPFDMFSWFGLLTSYILVCSCHLILLYFEEQDVTKVV